MRWVECVKLITELALERRAIQKSVAHCCMFSKTTISDEQLLGSFHTSEDYNLAGLNSIRTKQLVMFMKYKLMGTKEYIHRQAYKFSVNSFILTVLYNNSISNYFAESNYRKYCFENPVCFLLLLS